MDSWDEYDRTRYFDIDGKSDITDSGDIYDELRKAGKWGKSDIWTEQDQQEQEDDWYGTDIQDSPPRPDTLPETDKHTYWDYPDNWR